MARARTVVWQTERSVTGTRTWALESLAPTLVRWGFRVDQVTPDVVTLVRRRGWLALLTPSPLGFWADRGPRESISIVVTAADTGRSRLTVTGDVPKKVLRTLADLPGAVVR